MIKIAVMLLFTLAVAFAQEENPPSPGFNADGSDPRAIEIADQVMSTLGGRQNWDNTAIVKWRFFGRRLHVWNKHTGDLRYEDDNLTVLMNLTTQTGKAWEKGLPVENPDTLKAILADTQSRCINDSYWMFMPFKLKDSGVTLKYVAERKSLAGESCDVLQLTFEGVGDTPENKYQVYVDKNSHLVVQWDFFQKASDPQPRFSTPWKNWERYGNILLSDSRGERGHSEIAVYQTLPASVWQDPAPVQWVAMGASQAQKAQ